MRKYFSSVFVAFLSAFIYYRAGPLFTILRNHPARLQRLNNLEGFDIKFADVIRNCEDIELNENEGWALLSCDPGRDEWNTVMGTFVNPIAPPSTGLYLYPYSEGPSAKLVQLDLGLLAAQKQDFHPLGINYHAPSRTLVVANHAHEHSKLEIYKLDATTRTATQLYSFHVPSLAAPNSIAIINEDEFLVTNDHYFLARTNTGLSRLESYAGIPGGGVVYVKLHADEQVETKTLAHVTFANGIVFLNSTTIAVAGSTAAAVLLYHIDYHAGAPPTLTYLNSIKLGFIPDNLSVDGEGRLLIAGHPHAPSLEEVAMNNGLCQDVEANATRQECRLHRMSWISEWSEGGGLRNLYIGSEFGTSTTAVRDVGRGVGFAVGLYERGLLTWKS